MDVAKFLQKENSNLRPYQLEQIAWKSPDRPQSPTPKSRQTQPQWHHQTLPHCWMESAFHHWHPHLDNFETFDINWLWSEANNVTLSSVALIACSNFEKPVLESAVKPDRKSDTIDTVFAYKRHSMHCCLAHKSSESFCSNVRNLLLILASKSTHLASNLASNFVKKSSKTCESFDKPAAPPLPAWSVTTPSPDGAVATNAADNVGTVSVDETCWAEEASSFSASPLEGDAVGSTDQAQKPWDIYLWTSPISTCSKVTRGFSLYKQAWKIVSGSMTVWKWSKCPSLWLKNLSTKPDFSRWKGAATANFCTDRYNSSCVTTDKFTGTVPVAILTLSKSYECCRDNDKNWIHHNKCLQMQPPKIDNFTSFTYQSSLTPKLPKYSQTKAKQTMTKIVKLAFRFHNPCTHAE